MATGQPITLALRPHDIHLASTDKPGDVRFSGKVHLTEPLGDVTILDVKAQDATMKMVLREEIAAKYQVGQNIDLGFDPADAHLFDRETGARLGAAAKG